MAFFHLGLNLFWMLIASAGSVASKSHSMVRCSSEQSKPRNLDDLMMVADHGNTSSEAVPRSSSSSIPNSFVGQWCATEDNDVFPDEKIIINADGSMISVNSKRKLIWSHKDRTQSGLMSAKMQKIIDRQGTRNHSEVDNGLSVLFEVTTDDTLVWVGPIRTDDFSAVDRKTPDRHLLQDSRRYKMKWTRCEAMAF